MNSNPMRFDFGIARRVLQVSVPLMGSMVGNLIMMLVDRICLARYSDDTLAASGPAIYTAMAIVGFFTAFAGFSRSCVAQAFGRSGRDEAAYQAAVGMVVAAVLAAVLVLLAPVIELIPRLSNRPAAITALESQFLYWAAYFGSVMTLNMSLSSYFSGIGQTRVTLIAGLIGQVVELFMTVGLVFGKFGLPELGMRGSAIGTLFGTSAMLVFYLSRLPQEVWHQLTQRVFKRGATVVADMMLRVRRGLPLGVSAGVDNLGNAAFIWMIAGLGAIALAANNVNLTVNYIGIVPLIGLGIGCSVLCGNAIGANDFSQVPRIIFVTWVIELAYVAVVALFEITMPEQLLNPFGLSHKPEAIRSAAVGTAQVLWLYALAFTFSMTGAAVLEAFGLTRFLFATRLVLMWAFSIPTIYFMTLGRDGNADFLPICWVVGAFFEGVIGAMYVWRIWTAVKHRQNAIALAPAGA
ncbi:polysaccharide biosynthesis C-terminal domain-containing protein [Ideonella azotifigens]|uniref:MATE family efflux transporter n=1 Tax=Ideonella azotifigens TaxID=513160 RepID=A0ABP3VF07_9BURK|nr:MATE family efflux transporter [Ideonella azotifigens]MCD2343892.1 polysaccharide biosynthesis C-terminal domain-containing protein [Ideonella azotifigens]